MSTERRRGQTGANDDHTSQRVGDQDQAATNETQPGDEGSDPDRSMADGDRPTHTDGQRSSAVDDGDERVPEQTGLDAGAEEAEGAHRGDMADLAAVAGFTVASAEVAVASAEVAADSADGNEATVRVNRTEAAELDPVVVSEPTVGNAARAGDGNGEPSAQADDTIAGDSATTPTDTLIDEAGAHEGNVAATDPATRTDDGSDLDEATRRSSSNAGAERPESGHDGEQIAPELTDGAAATDTAGGSNTAVAAGMAMTDHGPTAPPDANPLDAPTSSSSSTDGPETAGVAPLGQTAAAQQPDTGTDPAIVEPSSPSEPTDVVDRTTTDTGDGGADTIEQPTGLGNDRPSSSLSPVASHRAPVSTPTRAAAAATEASNPTPELVELQTTGLAERLRPAFAAVRRGVNGLDELRLRVQDDNAGPIKVDISTVDNRIRVLLSTGNDDLMRQLGQERDRLADELRRAGFDEASIDIESSDRGRRNGRYDQEGSGGAGSGAAGSRPLEANATDSIDHATSRRHRGLTGLDLDL